MKYIDLFAGVGGFRYGIQNIGSLKRQDGEKDNLSLQRNSGNTQTTLGESTRFHCVYSNEWDKYANSIYKKHYGECDSRDIREVKAEELPDFDLLCGGFPCQSFSIAGKRGGFQDTRGTLFFEIARIIKQKQPRFLLLENVKGLLSHDKGSTFVTIISTLDELGYDCQWQVLNSKNFGVPQSRERVFIIGHLRGTSRPQVFPILSANNKNIKVNKVVGKVKVRKHIVNVEKLRRVLRDNRKSIKYLSEKLGVKKTTVEHWFRTDNCFSIPDPEIWLQLKEELEITTDEFDKPIMEFEIRDNKFDQSNRVYQKEGLAPTLTTLTGGHQHSAIDDGYSIRRLTPVECERLQGFPDNYTQFNHEGKMVSDTQRYKMMGNAVTTNVITVIVEKLLLSLGETAS